MCPYYPHSWHHQCETIRSNRHYDDMSDSSSSIAGASSHIIGAGPSEASSGSVEPREVFLTYTDTQMTGTGSIAELSDPAEGVDMTVEERLVVRFGPHHCVAACSPYETVDFSSRRVGWNCRRSTDMETDKQASAIMR